MLRRFIIASVLAAFGVAKPVWSENHRLQPDFTFKRVGVPQAGQGNLINVQVAPQSDDLLVSSPRNPAVPGATGSIAESAWFWELISPDLEDSRPGRLQLALDALGKAPESAAISVPRLSALLEIASAHNIDLLRTTVGTNVSPALVLAVIAVESSGDSAAVSRVGAAGLMQLMPATADRFGVQDRLDPVENIQGGVAYLDWLMAEFDNDPILVLAAYNAGAGAIRDAGGVPDFPETRDYVPKVISAWSVARALCITPPELVSDGCVFSIPASGG